MDDKPRVLQPLRTRDGKLWDPDAVSQEELAMLSDEALQRRTVRRVQIFYFYIPLLIFIIVTIAKFWRK